jgi:hypothetical protein
VLAESPTTPAQVLQFAPEERRKKKVKKTKKRKFNQLENQDTGALADPEPNAEK